MRINKYFNYNVVVVIFLSMMLFSCSGKDVAQPTSPPVSTMIALTPTVSVEADLTVDLGSASGSVVELQEGEILQVKHPALASEWQVNFSSDLFEPLTPPEMMRSPGTEGWFFRAKAKGQGRFTFTSIVSCDSPVPCSRMPARLELSVDVR